MSGATRRLARGLVAGAGATVAMTGYQIAVMKLRGQEGSTVPGQVLKRVLEGATGREISDERMALLNNVGHFAYGSSWGIPYALAHGALPGNALARGSEAGAVVWGTSLVELPLLDLAPPVWEQPPLEVALDASYHLVYGLALAATYRALASRAG